VLVAVADDGEGIDPHQARDLARRFARGTARDGGRRFGLGLALVDEVARVHGGRLDVDGAPGHGATFTLHLPASAN
jgi:signal transduction histidine kinase